MKRSVVRSIAVGLLLLVPRMVLAEEPAEPATTAKPACTPMGATEFDAGYRDGSGAARHAGVAEWAVLGGGGTCVLGPLGCGGAAVAAEAFPTRPPSPSWLVRPSDSYQTGYAQGFDRTIRERRTKAALVGGGVVITAAAIIAGAVIVAEFQQANRNGI